MLRRAKSYVASDARIGRRRLVTEVRSTIRNQVGLERRPRARCQRYQSIAGSDILGRMGNPQLSSGSVFANRFAIERRAGSGGMGTIYRARDRYSGDLVALKLLHAGSSGSEEGERFAREGQLLSELHHPGIVSHISSGQTPDGQRFLAMEWLDGEDLSQRLTRGPLPLRDSLRLLWRVADALSAAHRCGILHRDNGVR